MYNWVSKVIDRLVYDISNFLIISHSNYHLIITNLIDEIKHIFSELKSTFEWFYLSIFSHSFSCLDDDLTTSLHALYADLKILRCKIISFILNDSFYLINWMNSMTTITDTKFDESSEIFNEIQIWWLSWSDHTL